MFDNNIVSALLKPTFTISREGNHTEKEVALDGMNKYDHSD